MNVIAVIFITHVYETVFLIKEREKDIIQFEKLQRSKAEAELEALKNQIDPHFMFNSLNTLSHLIKSNKEKAFLFNEKLADVYRYILMNKDSELVQLSEEIQFLNNYYSLLKIRYGESIELCMEGLNDSDHYLIPPISLQLLIENAVKHNEIYNEDPLKIDLRVENSSVIISNHVRPKARDSNTPKVGLKSLTERFKIITERDIKVKSDSNIFSVTLPLLKSNA
jgi:LytS/YehU family sensor histidine kinase